jgi:hypothetical protein
MAAVAISGFAPNTAVWGRASHPNSIFVRGKYPQTSRRDNWDLAQLNVPRASVADVR